MLPVVITNLFYNYFVLYVHKSFHSAIFIGRSEYSISMYKEESLEKHWNVSFSDYTVHATKLEPHNYQFLHLASTSNGELATVDKFTGMS